MLCIIMAVVAATPKTPRPETLKPVNPVPLSFKLLSPTTFQNPESCNLPIQLSAEGASNEASGAGGRVSCATKSEDDL